MTKFASDPKAALGHRSTHQHPKQTQVMAQIQKGEIRRLNVHLPASLHKSLKMHAVEHDMDMKSIVIDALNEYLHK